MAIRVLLVDDEKAVLDVASHMLEALGFDVVTAADGRAALDCFSADPSRFTVVRAFAGPACHERPVAPSAWHPCLR